MPTKPLKLLPRKKEGPIKCLFCREIQKSRAGTICKASVFNLISLLLYNLINRFVPGSKIFKTLHTRTLRLNNNLKLKISVFYDHANVEHLDEIAKTWASCPECSKYFPDMTKMRMHLAKHANSGWKSHLRV